MSHVTFDIQWKEAMKELAKLMDEEAPLNAAFAANAPFKADISVTLPRTNALVQTPGAGLESTLFLPNPPTRQVQYLDASESDADSSVFMRKRQKTLLQGTYLALGNVESGSTKNFDPKILKSAYLSDADKALRSYIWTSDLA